MSHENVGSMMIKYILLFLVTIAGALGEEAVDGKVVYQQMKRSADLLDKKILVLGAEFKRLDIKTEALIQSSIDLLAGSKDSAETDRSVLRNKKNFIDGLNANTKAYLVVQEKVKKQLAKTGLVYGEEFLKIHKWLDARVTLRTGQVTSLVKSFENYKDADEHEGAIGNAREADAEKDELIKKMKSEMGDLNKKIQEAEGKMKAAESVEQVKALSVNIESYHNRVQLLQMSVKEVLMSTSQAEAVTKEEEEKIDQKVREKSIALQGNLKTLMSYLRSFYSLAEERALLRYKMIQLEKILEDKKAEP